MEWEPLVASQAASGRRHLWVRFGPQANREPVLALQVNALSLAAMAMVSLLA